jgi:hypothetical protein
MYIIIWYLLINLRINENLKIKLDIKILLYYEINMTRINTF